MSNQTNLQAPFDPVEVSEIEMAFPAEVKHLMPAMDDIPAEFKGSGSNKWVKFQSNWFYEGLKAMPESNEGFDQMKAMRHLHCIQRSFEPKHEHKVAAIAFLASLWLKEPT